VRTRSFHSFERYPYKIPKIGDQQGFSGVDETAQNEKVVLANKMNINGSLDASRPLRTPKNAL
jgi:hypothetical protein